MPNFSKNRTSDPEVMAFGRAARGPDAQHQPPGTEGRQERLGLEGGADENHMYQVKHWVRAMLFALDRVLPDFADDIPLSSLLPFLPDQLSHVEPVKDLTGSQIKERFGTSSLCLSCWTCMADTVTNKKCEKLHKETGLDLNAVLLDLGFVLFFCFGSALQKNKQNKTKTKQKTNQKHCLGRAL